MARFTSVIAVLFLGLFQASDVLAAVENSSWGNIKAQTQEYAPVAKLVVSSHMAGGWKGIHNQPYIIQTQASWDDDGLHRSWSNRGWAYSAWVGIVNPTGVRINGIDVLFTYDEDVFLPLGINTDLSATTFIKGGTLKAVMRSSEGYNTDITDMFRLFMPVRADAPIGHTAIVCNLTMYGEDGERIAVQTSRWVVDIVE